MPFDGIPPNGHRESKSTGLGYRLPPEPKVLPEAHVPVPTCKSPCFLSRRAQSNYLSMRVAQLCQKDNNLPNFLPACLAMTFEQQITPLLVVKVGSWPNG